MLAAKDLTRRIAKQDISILITGESGTGKEMFAQSIHNLSKRRNGPFVKINCASIPLELIEAELFGYEPGAFTGAGKKPKIGKFQMADGGTLFLDEIGDMHLAMQAKVLRVIQEKEVERLGSNKTHKIDFRVIAATNKNLQEAIQNREFRADLYYRLNVAPLMLPPLRQRDTDIEHLLNFLLMKNSINSNNKLRFSSDALTCLKTYPWPGNVREFVNAVTFAMGNADNIVIEKWCLPPQLFN
jgi:transcriptional regulator with PAS, ATPase and Fis domain